MYGDMLANQQVRDLGDRGHLRRAIRGIPPQRTINVTPLALNAYPSESTVRPWRNQRLCAIQGLASPHPRNLYNEAIPAPPSSQRYQDKGTAQVVAHPLAKESLASHLNAKKEQ
jgi:hypothetical protein